MMEFDRKQIVHVQQLIETTVLKLEKSIFYLNPMFK